MDETGRLAGGKLGEYATGAAGGRERPLSEVLRDIIGNVQEMVRGEVKLAKAEIREEAQKTFAASKLLAIGAVIGLYGGLFIMLAVVYGLSLVLPAWAAALIVGVVLSGAAYGMISAGRQDLSNVNPTPALTVESVKENVEWMKDRTK
jgi:uncharacterized membrane protein YqjE